MVKICDAIMGSGKTSAAISYIFENFETKRFIYVTPYNDECMRIKEACNGYGINFDVAINTDKRTSFSKTEDFRELLKTHENIAVSHELFKRCDCEMLELIKGGRYTIIIDEVVEVFQDVELTSSDLKLLISSEFLFKEYDDEGRQSYSYNHEKIGEYEKGRFRDFFNFIRTRRLNWLNKDKTAFWTLNKELFEVCDEIFILTFMFEGSLLSGYLKRHEIPYEYIGIRTDRGIYEFAENTVYKPLYLKDLKNKIHIEMDEKLNAIGEKKTALSATWYETACKKDNNERMDRLNKNIYTYFRSHVKDIPGCCRMWTSYKRGLSRLRRKGYYRSDVPYNARATNEYRNKKALVYAVNVFLNPNYKNYLSKEGIEVNDDAFALSTMVQWIWRSAIRDGKDIYIYIPSRRMRELLINWLEEVSE